MRERYLSVKDTEEFQHYDKARKLIYRENNPERILFLSAKNRAKKSDIEFTIELSDIIIPDVCPLLGRPITKIIGQGKKNTNPSVDRIDPIKGYIKGNVQVISFLANKMKQDASREELLLFANGVLSLYG